MFSGSDSEQSVSYNPYNVKGASPRAFGIPIASGVWRRPAGTVVIVEVLTGMRFYGATESQALKAARAVFPRGSFKRLAVQDL